MGDIEEATATKKAINILRLALGTGARKTIADNFSSVYIARIRLKNYRNCFEKSKNELLDKEKFLSRKQKESETLRQFWNELNGLAAKCNFGQLQRAS